jgi:hypothetical protein
MVLDASGRHARRRAGSPQRARCRLTHHHASDQHSKNTVAACSLVLTNSPAQDHVLLEITDEDMEVGADDEASQSARTYMAVHPNYVVE